MTSSEPVRGVSGTTVTLRTSGGSAVRYSAATRVATLKPSATLRPGQRYTVTVTSGIRDAAGNRLAPTTWTFTTGSA